MSSVLASVITLPRYRLGKTAVKNEQREALPPKAGQVADARGRKVTQVDPVTMHLLRCHDVIEADDLRSIVSEEGIAISPWERALLVYCVIAFLATVTGTIYYFVGGSSGDSAVQRVARLTWYSLLPVFFWWRIKRGRFVKTTAGMLKHLRCPHCGYDLRSLRVDPTDGATVCPECGCAWRLDSSHIGDLGDA